MVVAWILISKSFGPVEDYSKFNPVMISEGVGKGGSFAVVQPQDVCTLKKTTGFVEIFVKLKTKCASVVSAVTFVSFVVPSQTRIPSGNGPEACDISGT